MTSQSAFNRRVRRLWSAFILLQLAISDHLLPCGTNNHRLMIADQGYEGQFWREHWMDDYAAQIVTLPSATGHPCFSALRQVVEPTFANPGGSFGLQYPVAHSTWGLITRIAAKPAAYALGIQINRMLNRLDFAFPILIV